MAKLVLIDANALIHRAYHAYPANLANSEGVQTNAVYGFCVLLLDILSKHNPQYIVCAFDSAAPTFRHKEFEEYKAQRKPMDEELRNQFPLVKQVLEAFNIPIFAMDGYEADDIIGTLANSTKGQDLEKIIFTGDQDILQLIDDVKKIRVFLSGFTFSSGKIYDSAEFKAKYGFAPRQIIEYKSLLGDPSDNIPGVSGIGKKGATELVQQFGSLEEIYSSLQQDDHIWWSQPWKKLYTKLSEGKKSAEFSKYLATIATDVPIEFDLQAAELQDYSPQDVSQVFKELGFMSLLKKLPASKHAQAAELKETREDSPQADVDYRIISSPQEVEKLLTDIADVSTISIDAETDGLIPDKSPFLGLSISWALGKSAYFTAASLDSAQARKKFTKFLEGRSKSLNGIVGHNLKFDLKVLSALDIDITADTGNMFDTLLSAYVLGGGDLLESRGLKQLVKQEFGYTMDTIPGMLAEEPGRKSVKDIPVVRLGNYCCADSDYTLRLFELHRVRLAENKQVDKLFRGIEMPLIGMLLRMETVGMCLDEKILSDLRTEALDRLQQVEQKIYTEAGRVFNIGSPKQVGDVLFLEKRIQDGSKIPVGKTKSGGFSTDERTLMNFASQSDLVQDILQYRELSKLLSTYIDALLEKLATGDRKVHTTFNQAIAATGRLSSSDPNLQNIPIASDIGSRIRRAFSAGMDRTLISLDYAQQELRLLAHFSREEKLIQAFRDNTDIHSLTASEILHIPIDQVTKEQRRIGKTVNFGVIYGISGFGLSDRLKISRAEADQFIREFFQQYPGVQEYFRKLKTSAYEEGVVYTIFGRQKLTGKLQSGNYQVRVAIEREVLNFPLQGSAADIIKLGMVNVDKALHEDAWLRKQDVLVHLQIHDELLLSVPIELPIEDTRRVASTVRDLLSGVVELRVPLLVDAEIGTNWYDLKSFEI